MIVRAIYHGQTDLEAEGCIQGKSDRQLTDAGKEHVQKAAEALQSAGITMIICPPQTHAVEAAELIAESLGLEKTAIVKNAMLAERDFGENEDKPASEVDMLALVSWAGNVPVPGGETVRETAGRVYKYFSNIFKLFRARTILLVIPRQILMLTNWHFHGLPDAGKELAHEADDVILYEFETDDIPPEMVDFQSLIDKQESDTDSQPDRMLSQSEIDALIAQMMGG